MFDASPLNHFARAGELHALRDLVSEYDWVTTKAMLAELRRGAEDHPSLRGALALEWLRTVPCDDLDVLYLFTHYTNQLGNHERNAGEATVLAWAEAHEATAYLDDEVAYNVGRSRQVTVRRTLGLIIAAHKSGGMSEARARALVESLADTDARFHTKRDSICSAGRG